MISGKTLSCVLLAALIPFGSVGAQDALPTALAVATPLSAVEPLPERWRPDSVFVSVALPSAFADGAPNEIDDPQRVLRPIFERLYGLRTGLLHDTLRILHIGDSHVRGHIFPQTTGAALRADFGAIDYEDMGVNGATCLTFTHDRRLRAIADYRPDLLILSFGTNEAHNRRYNASAHHNQVDELIGLLRRELPDVPILLTTPPGAYERRGTRRRRTYTVNPRTDDAAQVIRRYADEHGLASWDLYAVGGGAAHWQTSGLMRPDHIHFLEQGYALQGALFYQALMNAYNHSISEP
jgi:lysophospholipase L1-like esterase